MKTLDSRSQLEPDVVVGAYRTGYFPMASSETGVVSWYSPDPRAIIPLDSFTISRSLRQVIRKGNFELRIDTAFRDVIRRCARRENTWISDQIIETYTVLHLRGYAHSVESWLSGQLVGGLYGVAVGAAFFGESMFSIVTNASKVALVRLVELLKLRHFKLLDTQFMNEHLIQFGTVEIPRSRYLELLSEAIGQDAAFR
jgi:leucyl/phenylalanyl-tRNA---protein transferase